MKTLKRVLSAGIPLVPALLGSLPCAVVGQTGPRVSADMVAKAAADIPIAKGPYQPTWQSVSAHQPPAWFQDARFGLSMHWGLYAVPAHQSEWYVKHMYGNSEVARWHREHFGPQDQFGYKDFIPLFTCEKFNADEWAALFKKSGARYVMPTVEHHDGFALWDSALTKFDAKDLGPKRDLIGELAVAVRKQGLKFGACNHRMEHFTFITPLSDLKSDLYDPGWAEFYSTDRSPVALERFLHDWVLRNFELIDKYQLDLLWWDNGVNGREFDPLKLEVFAHFYNRAIEWKKDVSMVTKGEASLGGHIEDYERQSRAPKELQAQPFETHDSPFQRWGYLSDAQYWNVGTLIVRLVENVCRNGNLLLNLAPKPDGTIPDEQKALLAGIGRWLDVNGEAIYGTRPWTKAGEGVLNLERGQRYSPADIRFTTKGDTLYAIFMAWPDKEGVVASLATTNAPAGKIASVTLLGDGEELEFSQDSSGLRVKFPAAKPCDTAYALKITGLKLK